MELWHTNFASIDRMPLLRDADANRPLAIWRLAKLQLVGLVLFCIVDDHLHLLLRGNRDFAGRVVARIKRTWADLLAGNVSDAFHRRVEGRRHLLSLIPYFLAQPRIHGLATPSAQWDGSCFYDLIGARRLAPLHLELPELLPRLSPTTIYQAADLTTLPLPADGRIIRAAGPKLLWEAAHRAFAVDPSCGGRTWRTIAARTTIVQLAREANIGRTEIIGPHCFAERTWRRLARRDIPTEMLDAVRLQLALHLPTSTQALTSVA